MAIIKKTGSDASQIAADGETKSGNVSGDTKNNSFVVDDNSTLKGILLADQGGNDSVLLDSGGQISGSIRGGTVNSIEIYNNTKTEDGIAPRQTSVEQFVGSSGGNDTLIIDGSGYTGTDQYAISINSNQPTLTGIFSNGGNDSITVTDGVIVYGGIDQGAGSDTVNIGPDVRIVGNITAATNDGLSDTLTIDENATVTGSIIMGAADDIINIAGKVGSGLASSQIAGGAGDNNITIASTAVVDVGRIDLGTGTTMNTGSTLTIENGAQITLHAGGFSGGAIAGGGHDDNIYLGGTYNSDSKFDVLGVGGSDYVTLGSDFSATNTGPNSVFEIDGGGNSLTTETDTLDISAISKRIDTLKVDANNPQSGTITLTDGTVIKYTEIEELIMCFADGTVLETTSGPVLVEKLHVGDMVHTRDNGVQPIRWIGSRKLSAAQLKASPEFRPIRIRAGALGENKPETDLTLSPQHRVLVRSKIAHRMFGTDEVLVAAKHLMEIDGVELADDATDVEYFHILFDQHEIVFSNGAETESLHTGSQALQSLSPAARKEIFSLFPELENDTPDENRPTARPLIKGRMGRQLALRHNKNSRELVC